MPVVRTTMEIGVLLAAAGVAGAAGLVACGPRAATAAHDPCTLVSANEVAPYVGLLATPPYRTSDGAADVRGDQCMYRGKDGRELTVSPVWSAAGTAAKAAVQAAANPGPWDKATWIPIGSLIASKGERSAQIDVSAASGREEDAVAVAKIVMPRFDHPLHYDGGKAVALAPKPVAHPASACDFLPRAAVEAAIGPLARAPSSDAPETSCTYRAATAQGVRDYAVEFLWQGGQKNYAMHKHAMATVSGMVGTPSSSPLDTIVTGPWDNASLVRGTQLMAVRHDVFVSMRLESADYERAKALLAAICSRL